MGQTEGGEKEAKFLNLPWYVLHTKHVVRQNLLGGATHSPFFGDLTTYFSQRRHVIWTTLTCFQHCHNMLATFPAKAVRRGVQGSLYPPRMDRGGPGGAPAKQQEVVHFLLAVHFLFQGRLLQEQDHSLAFCRGHLCLFWHVGEQATKVQRPKRPGSFLSWPVGCLCRGTSA